MHVPHKITPIGEHRGHEEECHTLSTLCWNLAASKHNIIAFLYRSTVKSVAEFSVVDGVIDIDVDILIILRGVIISNSVLAELLFGEHARLLS